MHEMDPPNASKVTTCFGIKATTAHTRFVETDFIYYTTIIVCIVNGLIAIAALFANTLVFVAVLRKAELRTLYNTSILCLAFADLLVCLLAEPAFIAMLAEKLVTGRVSCTANLMKSILQIWCAGLAAATLNVITLERYFAIFHPFKYQHYATRKRIILVMVAVWFFWTVTAISLRLMPGLSESVHHGVGAIFIFSDLVITTFVYAKIYKLSHRDKVAPANATNALVRNAQETKAAKTVVCITGALFLNHFPILIAFGLNQTGRLSEEDIIHAVFPLAETFLFSSALLDPLIYVWRNWKVRRSMREFLTNLATKHPQEDPDIPVQEFPPSSAFERTT